MPVQNSSAGNQSFQAKQAFRQLWSGLDFGTLGFPMSKSLDFMQIGWILLHFIRIRHAKPSLGVCEAQDIWGHVGPWSDEQGWGEQAARAWSWRRVAAAAELAACTSHGAICGVPPKRGPQGGRPDSFPPLPPPGTALKT